MEENNRNEIIVETIKNNIRKIGYDYDLLSEKNKQYLITIEQSITETFELEQKAREMISKNTVSVKGVSNKTQIARQTLYNNPLLKEYINYRSKAFDRIDASKQDTSKDEQIKKLKEEITALHMRDVELMEAKREIKELKKQLKEKDDAIANLTQSPKGSILYRIS